MTKRMIHWVLAAIAAVSFVVQASAAGAGSLVAAEWLGKNLDRGDVLVIDASPTKLHAAGHIPGTAFPDEPGNVGIAGHRDTFFRKLSQIHRDDLITLTTPVGSYRYSVEWTRVVAPADVAVLGPSQSAVLTLVTCYPFTYVGPAPQRFIVRARRLE